MFHLIQTDYNIGLYNPRRVRRLLHRRFKVKPGGWMRHRLGIFKKFTIDSMHAQVNRDWTWVIRIDKKTPQADFDALAEAVGDLASIDTGEWDDIIAEMTADSGVPLLSTRLENDCMLRHDALVRLSKLAQSQSNRCALNCERGFHFDTHERKLWFCTRPLAPCLSLWEPTPPFTGVTLTDTIESPMVSTHEELWTTVGHRFSLGKPTLVQETSFEVLRRYW